MPKAFPVRGQIKEEAKGSFQATAEPITDGKSFKSADGAVYISSKSYCLLTRFNDLSTFAPITLTSNDAFHAISLQLRA